MTNSERSQAVDDYIAAAAPFARPILKKLRTLFHRGAPGCQEVMKWSVPHFDRTGPIGGMAAFKEHIAWGFWRGKELDDPAGILADTSRTDMRRMCVRSLADLPSDAVLLDYITRAAALDDKPRVKVARSTKPVAVPKTPRDFAVALAANTTARSVFDAFAPSHRKEYLTWILEAKRDETRARRIEQAVEWLAQGRRHNWRYETKSVKAGTRARTVASKKAAPRSPKKSVK